MEDILVSGESADDYLQNLQQLLQHLEEHELRCRLEKYGFAQSSVEYLGHKLTQEGEEKGCKIDTVKSIPVPSNVTSLPSFLGLVQFYGNVIPNLFTITAPLHQLTEKDTSWTWNKKVKDAFDNLKIILSNDTVLAHYDPSQQIEISCYASAFGIGAFCFTDIQVELNILSTMFQNTD